VAWVQFPFPDCPACSRNWSVTRHLDCPQRGSMELDPDKREVRCDGCATVWGVWQTNFQCLCGRQFTADEVDNAVREIIAAAALLARVIEQNQQMLGEIRRMGNDSARSWLMKVVEGVGSALGTGLGHLVGFLAKLLF